MSRFFVTAVLLGACATHSSGPAPAGDDSAIIIKSNGSVVSVDTVSADSLQRAGVFLESRVDQRPVVLMMPDLKYPEDLRIMGIQGRVVFRCIIGRDGRVEPNSVRVVRADDSGFIFNARRSLLDARFRPAKVGGQPVRALVNVPFDYKIRGARR